MRKVIICVLNGHNFVARQSRSRKEDKVQSGKEEEDETDVTFIGGKNRRAKGKRTKENKTKGKQRDIDWYSTEKVPHG